MLTIDRSVHNKIIYTPLHQSVNRHNLNPAITFSQSKCSEKHRMRWNHILSMLIWSQNSENVTTKHFILTGMTAIPTSLNKSHSVIIKVLLKHLVSPHGGETIATSPAGQWKHSHNQYCSTLPRKTKHIWPIRSLWDIYTSSSLVFKPRIRGR